VYFGDEQLRPITAELEAWVESLLDLKLVESSAPTEGAANLVDFQPLGRL
jgi:hypothetical protein